MHISVSMNKNELPENQFELLQATPDDVSDIVKLYETVGISEQDKIVILPVKFRERAVQGAIAKKRLYVARTQEGELIGLKKFFVIQDEEEKHDVLTGELRSDQQPCRVALYNGKDFVDAPGAALPHEGGIHMYTGGDLTHPDYRGKGINTSLTNKALDDNIELVKELLDGNQPISLVYGITQHNAGEGDAHAKDRTISIVKSFEPFVQKLFGHSVPISYQRFPAFKPSFDQNADECKPLPDAYSVPGYGCVLTAQAQGGQNV